MKKSFLSIALVAVLVISGCSKPSTDVDKGGAESTVNTQEQAEEAVQNVNGSDDGVSDSENQTSEPVAESADAAKEDAVEKSDDSGQKNETPEPKEPKTEKPTSSQ